GRRSNAGGLGFPTAGGQPRERSDPASSPRGRDLVRRPPDTAARDGSLTLLAEVRCRHQPPLCAVYRAASVTAVAPGFGRGYHVRYPAPRWPGGNVEHAGSCITLLYCAPGAGRLLQSRTSDGCCIRSLGHRLRRGAISRDPPLELTVRGRLVASRSRQSPRVVRSCGCQLRFSPGSKRGSLPLSGSGTRRRVVNAGVVQSGLPESVSASPYSETESWSVAPCVIDGASTSS